MDGADNANDGLQAAITVYLQRPADRALTRPQAGGQIITDNDLACVAFAFREKPSVFERYTCGFEVLATGKAQIRHDPLRHGRYRAIRSRAGLGLFSPVSGRSETRPAPSTPGKPLTSSSRPL